MSTPFSSLDLIPSFHAVMTTGSLSGAARQLSLSQPTVRRHIEALEQELEATLFTRAPNGLTPTETAHTLMSNARAVLSEASALKRAASGGRDPLSGQVRITCSRVVAAHAMPALLKALGHTAPHLRIELDATDVTQNLLRREADIAVRFAQPTQNALIARKLTPVPVGIFATPDLATGFQGLRDIPFVSDDRENQILPGLEAQGLPPPQNITLRTDDALTQIEMLKSGHAAGVCQVGLAERFGLVEIPPKTRIVMPAWVVMHEDQAQVARIRHVFDHLSEMLPLTLNVPQRQRNDT